jgi:hypothetical protein
MGVDDLLKIINGAVLLIGATSGLIAAIVSFLNRKAIKDVHSQVAEVKINIDGKMEALLAAARDSGKLEEQGLKRSRDKEDIIDKAAADKILKGDILP